MILNMFSLLPIIQDFQIFRGIMALKLPHTHTRKVKHLDLNLFWGYLKLSKEGWKWHILLGLAMHLLRFCKASSWVLQCIYEAGTYFLRLR